MSDRKEELSALLDNALDVNELDEILGNNNKQVDEESVNRLSSRYQMIGEAMRSQVSDVSLLDVSLQVREAIEKESIEMVASSPEKASNNSTQSQNAPWFDFGGWLKPLGGLAVAASVAMITVSLVSNDNASVTGDVQQVAAGDNTVSDIPQNTLVSSVPVIMPSAQILEQNNLQQASTLAGKGVNLDAYLAEHAEFAAQDTMQGRMPYVRAVSYRSE